MTALDLRNGRMDKSEANKLVAEYEGFKPPSLELFLEYLDISESEFNEIVLNTVVPPHKPNIESIQDSPKTWDFEQWYRE